MGCMLGRGRFLLIAVLLLLSLLSAFIAEQFYGIMPCTLCLYLRYSYWLAVPVSFITYIKPHFLLKILQILAILGAFSLSFYHVGVEQHWWKGPDSCRAEGLDLKKMEGLSADEKLTALRSKLQARPAVRCDQVNWRILGVSATIWNTLFLIILLSVLGIGLWNEKKSSK